MFPFIAVGCAGSAFTVIIVLIDVAVGCVAHDEFEVNSTLIISPVFNPALA